MLTAICHCGAVSVEVPRKPRRLTNCNCSVCRRYGTLWAYYKAKNVRVTNAPRTLDAYSWRNKRLKFMRCKRCGCIMFWQPVKMEDDSIMGVNARNFEPTEIAAVRVRRLDGASTWKYFD
jgi:hypothetical protein